MVVILDFPQIVKNNKIIMICKWQLHSIYQGKFKNIANGKTKHYFTSPSSSSILKDRLVILIICESCFLYGFGTFVMNISSPNFKKIQNNHNLLKFHLSEKCKILNNSQLYKFYHINILNGDIFHLE